MEREIKTTNNWKYKIRIKDLFEDETTPELIENICKVLTRQLKVVYGLAEKSNIAEDHKEYVLEELELCTDNFEFLAKLANGDIPNNKWDDYSFNGDFEAEFNGYLSMLYDLADQRVITNDLETWKFIWIE